MSLPNIDPEYAAFTKIGVVLIIVFLVDQLKIEFLRITLVDYWHFIFALLGVLVAACDQANDQSLKRHLDLTAETE